MEALLLQEIDNARHRSSEDSPDTSTSDSATAVGALLQNMNGVRTMITKLRNVLSEPLLVIAGGPWSTVW